MSRRTRALDRLTALYRTLLRAYPARFREAYQGDLARVFRERCGRALAEGGGIALLGWIARALLDVLWSAALERLATLRRRVRANPIPGDRGDSAASRLLRNLRLAIRALARQPGSSALLLLTLALGTGATVAFFSLVDAALLRPLPYPDADRLVVVRQHDAELGAYGFAPPFLADLRERITGVERLAGFSPSWHLTLTGLGEPRAVTAAFVTDGLFDLLGVRARSGRTFDASEYATGGPRSVVVSRTFWERHFGQARPGGQTLELDGTPYTVVGILPDLELPITSSLVSRDGSTAELWLPFSANPFWALRAVPVMNVVGRLADGTTPERLLAEMASVAEGLTRDVPEVDVAPVLTAEPLAQVVGSASRRTVLTLFAASACLLLIACANVANLLLARATARGHEMAVRRSLGAGARHVLEQLLVESLVVAVLGCAAGLLVARVILAGVEAAAFLPLPPSAEVRMDLPVMAFAALLAAGTAVLFGLAPALHGARAAPAGALRSGTRETPVGGRARRLLVSGEVALAFTLLFGAGLLARSFWNLVHVDPGFRAEGLLAVPLSIGGDRYAAADARRAFVDRILADLGTLPGATDAAAVNRLPLAGGNVFVGVEIEGGPAGERPPLVDRRVATPGYFRTMDIPVIAGREFSRADEAESELRAAIVNVAFARRFRPGGDMIGHRMRLMLQSGPGPWLTVVGVVADVRHHALDQPAAPEIYVPFAQSPVASMNAVVRTTEPADVLHAAREAVWRLDPNLPLDGAGAVSALLDGSVGGPRVRALVLNGFAAIALLLSAVGLYGVLSYAVARGARETGVRLALGARARDVVGRVVREGLVVSARGVLLGLAGAWLLARALSGFLFEVEPADPLTFAGVAALLVLVSTLASWIPARRAARVDPVRALRGD